MPDATLETRPIRKPTFKDIFLDAVTKDFLEELNQASEQKKSYTNELEKASGEDVFKYLLLINVSALEAYIAQTRIQAQQSFNAGKRAAGVGFALIIVGIGLGIYSAYQGDKIIPAAYLVGIAGILSQFISGIFLYIYNRTLEQLNLFTKS